MDVETTITEVDEVTKKIDILVPAAKLDESYAKHLADTMKKISINGFRKGKAPKAIVEKNYGDSLFLECVDKCINDTCRKTFADWNVVGEPEFKIEECKRGSDLKCSVTVSLFPEPTISNYDKIDVEVEAEKVVTDEDVNATVTDFLKSRAALNPITDRTNAQKGDVVELAVSVISENEAPTPEEVTRGEIGGTEFPAEISDALVSMNVNETKDIQIALNQAQIDAGVTPKTFRVTLKSLSSRTLPEYKDDDELNTPYGKLAFSAYREKVREQLTKFAENKNKSDFESAVLAKLREVNEFKVPQACIDSQIRSLIQESRQFDPKKFDINKINLDYFRPQMGEYAERIVRNTIILNKVIEQEKLAATQEEVEAKVAEMAKEYGVEENFIRDIFLARNPEEFSFEIVKDKAFNLLRERTTVSYKEAETK